MCLLYNWQVHKLPSSSVVCLTVTTTSGAGCVCGGGGGSLDTQMDKDFCSENMKCSISVRTQEIASTAVQPQM